MGIANPIERVAGILVVLDQFKTRMEGTSLASIPWRPEDPAASSDLASLAAEALDRCDDVAEAMIIVTIVAVTTAAKPRPTN